MKFPGVCFSASLVCFHVCAAIHSACAQVVPDNTLPSDSLVNTVGTVYQIDGGTVVGSNLFHSFDQFSIPENWTAQFNNNPGLQTILARVTGTLSSDISGTMQANGATNLVLINPRGIMFGRSASLKLGGSFLASTAEAVKFADGSEFSAVNPQVNPLLTVSVPIGLQFGSTPASITNSSRTVDVGTGQIVGLQVQPDKTLALVGGAVTMDGGILTAAGGRIDVGAVGANSLVPIADPQRLAIAYNNVSTFQDVQFTNLARVDASGPGGGDIYLQGRTIQVLNGSQVLADTLGSEPGGILSVTASEAVEVIGIGPADGPVDSILQPLGLTTPVNSRLSTITFGEGTGGDIVITTKRLVVRDGPEIKAQAFDASVIGGTPFVGGKGGDVTVVASESVEVSGSRQIYDASNFASNPSNIFFTGLTGLPFEYFIDVGLSSNISTTSISATQAGVVRIDTGRVIVKDGGLVGANAFSSGNGGQTIVNAQNSIELSGTGRLGKLPSGITNTTFSPGDAGEIILNTRQLVVQNGAEVNSSTFTPGNAANITINASESIDLAGQPANSLFPSRLTAATTGSGRGGNITVNTNGLNLRDGATIQTSGTSTGPAGNLDITANRINLSNGASLTASTLAGTGGNIRLTAQDYVLLRNNSLITANASGTANGGNIGLNVGFAVAVLAENSDIIANAIAGNGGNIDITTTSIFGLVLTQGALNNKLSEINASSETGVSGAVVINNPDIDTDSGLVQLPEQVVDSSNQVVKSCAAAQGNSFTVTGRGGLPEDPTAALRGQTLWQDWQDWSIVSSSPQLPQARATQPAQGVQATLPKLARLPQPATGWRIDADGTVALLATSPEGELPRSLSQPSHCASGG